MAINPYHEWQRNLQSQLPDFAIRVFALRGKAYMGSGWHYSLEHSLGKVISIANDFGISTDRGFECEIINEVIVESFIESLEKAEASVRT